MRVDCIYNSCFCILLLKDNLILRAGNLLSRIINVDVLFLFNHALNTFYLRIYVVGNMVKDHSNEKENPLSPLHGLLFPISSKGYVGYHHTIVKQL